MNERRPTPALACALLATAIASSFAGCKQADNRTDAEHLAKARELHAQKEDKAAAVEIRNALQKNPKNTDARILMADIHLDNNNGKRAQTEIEIARQRGASPESTRYQLAQAYYLQSNFRDAAKEAQVAPATPQAMRAPLKEVEARSRVGMRQFADACRLFDESREADPKFVKPYLGSTACATMQRKPELALSTINQAIQIDPADSASWVVLGDVHRQQGRPDAAVEAYSKAIALKNNNLDALVGRALVYSQTRRLDLAEADLRTVDGFQKGNPVAVFIEGTVRFRQARYTDAKRDFETTLTAAPEYIPAILWLGMTNYVAGNLEVASTQLNQYVSLVPDAQNVRALLALLRARMGGAKQATIDLGELGKRSIDDADTLTLIGEAHTVLGDPSQGVKYLTRAVDLQPDSSETRMRLAKSQLERRDAKAAVSELRTVLQKDAADASANQLLVSAYVQQKDYAAAMAVAEDMAKRQPKDPLAENNIGGIHQLMGDKAAARAAFKRALDKSPMFFPAANNLALMAIQDNDLPAAKAVYEDFLKADPKSVGALLGLYNVDRKLGRVAEGEKALVAAAALAPQEPLPATLIAQHFSSSGRPRRAIDATDAAFRAHPDDPGLLEVRGLAYLGLNEAQNALVQFSKLVQQKPASADALVYLSAAQASAGDRAAAKSSLAAALKLDPKHYGARLAMGRVALTEGRNDDALSTARALAKERPDDPDGALLEASVYGVTRRSKDQLALLQSTIAKYPKSGDARLALVKAYSGVGDSSGVFQTIDDWRKADPQSALPLATLAEANLAARRDDAAIDAYRAQLKLAPQDPRALNNLAFLLREKAPDEALALSKQAVAADGRDANALDTLGQIQLVRGENKDAAASLRKANELDPRNARIRYHYATALAKAGDIALARRELERLLAANPGFDEAGDARRLLGTLMR